MQWRTWFNPEQEGQWGFPPSLMMLPRCHVVRQGCTLTSALVMRCEGISYWTAHALIAVVILLYKHKRVSDFSYHFTNALHLCAECEEHSGLKQTSSSLLSRSGTHWGGAGNAGRWWRLSEARTRVIGVDLCNKSNRIYFLFLLHYLKSLCLERYGSGNIWGIPHFHDTCI